MTGLIWCFQTSSLLFFELVLIILIICWNKKSSSSLSVLQRPLSGNSSPLPFYRWEQNTSLMGNKFASQICFCHCSPYVFRIKRLIFVSIIILLRRFLSSFFLLKQFFFPKLNFSGLDELYILYPKHIFLTNKTKLWCERLLKKQKLSLTSDSTSAQQFRWGSVLR